MFSSNIDVKKLSVFLFLGFIIFLKIFYFVFKIKDFPLSHHQLQLLKEEDNEDTNNKKLLSIVPFFEKESKMKNVKINFFDEKLKSGDLLFVSYVNDFVKYNFVKFFTNSIWTHIGIFYKDPLTSEAFVLEAATYDPP